MSQKASAYSANYQRISAFNPSWPSSILLFVAFTTYHVQCLGLRLAVDTYDPVVDQSIVDSALVASERFDLCRDASSLPLAPPFPVPRGSLRSVAVTTICHRHVGVTR